ncbi:MAG TPA: hypothetical protein VKQ72_09115 [Aggregatilineales bacterium]|nr:hypothetical protein [Aggregatilineales bacterium]
MPQRFSRRTFLRHIGVGTGAMAWVASGLKVAGATTLDPRSLKSPSRLDQTSFSYWGLFNQNVSATLKSYNDMLCYQELEKRTGVHINFQLISDQGAAQNTDQFNLLIASGQYPDMIEWNWVTAPGGPGKYLSDNVILKLNDLVDKNAPNLKKVLDANPEWRKQVVTDDGTLYCFPFLRGDLELQVFQGPIIRKDWLDKVGLPIPTTMDDWHTMLTAFKTKDPNGKGNEVPFTSSLYNVPLNAFLNAYAYVGAWGIAMDWYQDKGVVKYGLVQPEFKEFLATMAQWYKEGLYDVDFPTMDTKLEDAKVTGNQLGAFVQNTGGGIGKYLGLMHSKDPNFELVAAPYPVLKSGDKPLLGQRDPVYAADGSLAITSACKDPVAAVKWADYAYSNEGHLLFNFGVEGDTYTVVNGKPIYTDKVMKDPKLAVQQSMARFTRSDFNGPFVQDKGYIEQYASLPEQQDSLKVWAQPTNERRMPPVTQTQDESKQFASIMNDVNTLRDEAVIKTIVGQSSVSDWDSVVAQLQQIGIDTAVKLRQAALDRYNAR